jgi:hypothetical protein
VAAVTATVADAGSTLQGAAEVTANPSQGGSDQGAQAPAGKPAGSANAPVSVPGSGSAGASVQQALPATGSLPGVG